jgi:hypothetical protein
MNRGLLACVVAVFGIVLMLDGVSQGGDKDKITIKTVMKKAHSKGGLLSKVIAGDASAEEKKELVTLYEALAKNTPPKGDETSWKEKTAALVAAAKSADAAALKKASNCAACHSEHKGKK